jgi:hypothetical protein
MWEFLGNSSLELRYYEAVVETSGILITDELLLEYNIVNISSFIT